MFMNILRTFCQQHFLLAYIYGICFMEHVYTNNVRLVEKLSENKNDGNTNTYLFQI